MQFRFDANQKFPLAAIAAVVDLFEGQAKVENDLRFELGVGLAAVPNRLGLDEDTLLANLNAVQARNEMQADDKLEVIEDLKPRMNADQLPGSNPILLSALISVHQRLLNAYTTSRSRWRPGPVRHGVAG